MAITTIKGSGKIPTIYRNTALTNVTVQVSSVPIILTGINVINPNLGGVHAYVKFYDSTSATLGTTAIVRTVYCGSGSSVFIDATQFGQMYFGTAMCVAITSGIADSDIAGFASALHCEISYQIA